MDNVEIRKRTGSLHFIRFQTTDMGNFLSLAKQKGMAELVTTVCATGGGAYKFENDFREVSRKTLICMFIIHYFFSLSLSLIASQYEIGKIWWAGYINKRHFIFGNTKSYRVLLLWKCPWYNVSFNIYPYKLFNSIINSNRVCYSRKSEKKAFDFSQPYPFILVNVGSGVSILAVYGPDNYKRVSGTR